MKAGDINTPTDVSATPPDTPKPPAEIWVVIDDVGQPEYAASYPAAAQEHINDWIENASDSTVKILGLGKYSSHRYILAPSPQESHKLAEELERLIDNYIECDKDGARTVDDLLLAGNAVASHCLYRRTEIIAALRSSGQELEDIRASHKWCVDLARTVIVTEDRRAIEWYMRNLVDELQRAWQEIEALRSSPSEQDARDAERYRAIRNNTWNDVLCAALGKRVYGVETLVARGIALDSAADAIAASGGAKGDGK